MSNGASTHSSAINEVLFTITWISPLILGGLSALLPFYILYLIIVVDLPSRNLKVSFRNVFPQLNTLLILNTACFSGYCVSSALLSRSDQIDVRAGLGILTIVPFKSIFLAVVEVTYVSIGWIRSQEIIKMEFSETSLTLFKIILFLCPVSSIVPPITLLAIGWPVLLGNRRAYAVFAGTLFFNGTMYILVDQLFLSAFLAYSKKLAVEMPTGMGIGRRLQIIARFGIYSSVSMLVALQFFGASSICMLIAPSLEIDWIASVYYVAWILKDYFLAGMVVSMVGMKYTLVVHGKEGVYGPTSVSAMSADQI
ncbi:hypothetical protein HDU79_007827 [Rhizoclosmatium sp. JEL0117]|nr:hypothetical protein HDU79_007827 [Rhizoclosmatium sp. JEL0117]